MQIKKGTSFLMLKINTPLEVDFLFEHKAILEQKGEVWFCRFGKTNVVKSRITEEGNYVFLKDSAKNHNRVYVGTIVEISTSAPSENYPLYYNQIEREQALWFRLCEIKEVNPEKVLQYFRSKSSNAHLSSVYRSMCQSFYIISITDCTI